MCILINLPIKEAPFILQSNWTGRFTQDLIRKSEYYNEKHPNIIFKEKTPYDVLHNMNYIFSYFYEKKLYIKKIKSFKEFEETKALFEKCIKDEDKIKNIFQKIEDYEIFHNYKFETTEGIDLLRLTRAKFNHSKRFFNQTRLKI